MPYHLLMLCHSLGYGYAFHYDYVYPYAHVIPRILIAEPESNF